jgi:hypothetical protein
MECVSNQVLWCLLCDLQVSQADRIRKDIDAFTHRVQQHKASFASHVLYKYSTGYAAAHPMLDAAAAALAKLSKECKHFTELASVFELTNAVVPVTEAIKELFEQLVAVKDVWDCCMMCHVQFQVSNGKLPGQPATSHNAACSACLMYESAAAMTVLMWACMQPPLQAAAAPWSGNAAACVVLASESVVNLDCCCIAPHAGLETDPLD